MKITVVIFYILIGLYSLSEPLSLLAQGLFGKETSEPDSFDKAAFLRDYQPLVDTALQAYNTQNYEVFFENFAALMKSTATKQAFQTLYIDLYKKNYGVFLAKTLIPKSCSFNEDFPLLIYWGEFENDSEVIINVNFAKENDTYKIMQISFDKPEKKSKLKTSQ